VILVAIAVVAALDIDTVYEHPLLLAVLNTLFIGLFPIAVSVIAARSSIRGGPGVVLWMGCGMLVFGVGSIIAGWVVQIDPNFTVTVHNISVFFGALFHAIGALISINPGGSAARRELLSRGRNNWALYYAAILIGLVVLTFAVLSRVTPPFFIQGSSPTSIRQVVLGLSIILYIFSASVFLNLYLKSRSRFLYWYSIALGLIACGLLAVLAQSAVGTPLGWLGRFTQYLGGILAVAAIHSAQRSSAQAGTTIADIITSYFTDPQAGYRMLEELVDARTVSLEKEIAERVQVEEALTEQRHFLRQVIDTNPARIFVRDREGTYLLVNKAQAIAVGLTVENMTGRHCADVGYPPEMTAQFMEQDRQVMDSLEGIFIPEEEVSHHDGENRWSQVSKLPLIDPDGRSNRVLVVIVDVTERKQAEEIALTAQKLAGIGSLAAGMAHEINSPLQLVTGLSERLIRDLQADRIDKQQFLANAESINRNGWRIAKIIRSLLTYTRQSPTELEPQQLNDIIENTLLLIEHQLKTWSNISVEKELAPDLPLVHCDSNNITQVIINLLENARDAMPGGGWIKISTTCSPENGLVILRVSDTGSGMPAETQSRIFDPFFTTKDVGKGTGLGLSIVHGIIEAHSGEITMESASGKGTTFTISFPEDPPQIESPKDIPEGRYN
jgi:PAS domain S-box-containing protein